LPRRRGGTDSAVLEVFPETETSRCGGGATRQNHASRHHHPAPQIKKEEEQIMAKGVKHYLPNGKVYKGPMHKMNGQLHTGAKHSASSKVLKHAKPKKKQ
jgi:hypothetical protein